MSGKPALCFVHGMACQPDDWDSLRQLFADEFATSAPNLGFFEPDAGQERSMTVEALAHRVTADISVETVLIGHSLGCRVVLQAALERPEQTRAVVLLEGSRLSEIDPAVMLRPIADDPGAFLEDFFGQMMGDRMPTAQGRALIDRAKRIDQGVLADAMAAIMQWDRQRSRTSLAALQTTPILVLQSTTLGQDGKRRPLRPNETNAWMDAVGEECPGARLVTLAGYGHFPMIEEPAAVATPLRAFLASI